MHRVISINIKGADSNLLNLKTHLQKFVAFSQSFVKSSETPKNRSRRRNRDRKSNKRARFFSQVFGRIQKFSFPLKQAMDVVFWFTTFDFCPQPEPIKNSLWVNFTQLQNSSQNELQNFWSVINHSVVASMSNNNLTVRPSSAHFIALQYCSCELNEK